MILQWVSKKDVLCPHLQALSNASCPEEPLKRLAFSVAQDMLCIAILACNNCSLNPNSKRMDRKRLCTRGAVGDVRSDLDTSWSGNASCKKANNWFVGIWIIPALAFELIFDSKSFTVPSPMSIFVFARVQIFSRDRSDEFILCKAQVHFYIYKSQKLTHDAIYNRLCCTS